MALARKRYPALQLKISLALLVFAIVMTYFAWGFDLNRGKFAWPMMAVLALASAIFSAIQTMVEKGKNND